MPNANVPHHPIPFVITSKHGRKPKAEPRGILDRVRYCVELLNILGDDMKSSHADAVAVYGMAKLLDSVASELTKEES
jgi:hypothetical protein